MKQLEPAKAHRAGCEKKLAGGNEMKCSICREDIEVQVFPNGNKWTEGNNAQPINDGRCCDECNRMVVIPERFKRMQEAKKNGKI